MTDSTPADGTSAPTLKHVRLPRTTLSLGEGLSNPPGRMIALAAADTDRLLSLYGGQEVDAWGAVLRDVPSPDESTDLVSANATSN